MADRCTLHISKLEDFKLYLIEHGVAYRPGKGDYQALQVQTDKNGWQCIYRKDSMPEHYSVQDKLMPLVRRYLRHRRENADLQR